MKNYLEYLEKCKEEGVKPLSYGNWVADTDPYAEERRKKRKKKNQTRKNC